MRKTFYSILPVIVFLGPTFSRLPLIGPALSPVPADRTAVVMTEPNRRSGAAVIADGVRTRISEARQLLEAIPAESTDFVTLAVEEAEGARVHLLRLAKEDFLRKDGELTVLSSLGAPLRLKILRPNYVNTAVSVTAPDGRELKPLVVQYPIESGGALKEVAYYTSAHPAVSARQIERAGGEYVHEKLNAAAERLAQKGEVISPEIIDAAERLCLVEHTDHKRFLTENHSSLFREILTLYALNGGDTYRYSVSSAGAGGMVQMIPPTYKTIREMYPRVGLREDFVEGMRDHDNALEAMLLYMQWTWDKLLAEDEIEAALRDGRATQQELLAAGYNSNPLKLAGYLARGGDGWRTLIPEETQMYLRIYSAVDSLVDFRNRG